MDVKFPASVASLANLAKGLADSSFHPVWSVFKSGCICLHAVWLRQRVGLMIHDETSWWWWWWWWWWWFNLEHKIVNTGQMIYCSQANLHLPNWMLMRTTYFSSLIYIKQGWCEMQNVTYRFIRIHWQNACRRLTRPQLSLLRKETTGDESVPTIHVQREFRRSSLHVM